MAVCSAPWDASGPTDVNNAACKVCRACGAMKASDCGSGSGNMTRQVCNNSHRSIQAFKVVHPAWVKYIQLHFLTHHGSEPVCALNDVRIFGKSAADDLEDRLAMDAVQASPCTAVPSLNLIRMHGCLPLSRQATSTMKGTWPEACSVASLLHRRIQPRQSQSTRQQPQSRFFKQTSLRLC